MRPDVISNCSFPNWKPKKTQVYDGALVDRPSDSPQSVRTEIFMNGTKPKIRAGQPFVISNVTSCSSEYVGLEAQSVPTFAADGESQGPTVPGTDEGSGTTTTNDSGGTTKNESGQAGFGALASLVGVGGAAAWRARRK